MFIIDCWLDGNEVRRLKASKRGMLVKEFDDLVEGREVTRVSLTVCMPHGNNRYVVGVDAIKEYLRTGDPDLFYYRKAGGKRPKKGVLKYKFGTWELPEKVQQG